MNALPWFLVGLIPLAIGVTVSTALYRRIHAEPRCDCWNDSADICPKHGVIS